jgi:uncharacterized protein
LDRSKDKAAAETPLSAVSERIASAAEVVAYLKRHPDFFAEHPELLDLLTPPAATSGAGVVDMQQFMLKRQRDDIAKLKGQQRSLIGTTRANLASQTRVHSAVLTLLAANSFEQLIQIVTTDLAVLLDADVVTIGVESSGTAKPRLPHPGVQILEPGTVDRALGPERDVVLLSDVAGDPKLFGAGADLARSAALLRLIVSRTAPPGLLCIGTRRPGKFHPGQGTELLGFLARALGITIAAWLDLPA